ncbi:MULTISPECIES: ABC transporter substrate-binding protein [Halorussus]|uniref:ABC transporter substrate-binding protein n=1 Tax=Halorussus TaxID=1070314 RepID=UPI000E217EC0|nr:MULTISPECIES: ABC transporter substrate-binding protein [Halorussus]NHN60663.1 ABC transporter substrate-binding protein [Halorussus sp. JP-T4]
MTDTDSVSRRRFLQATGGAASAVALAGCTGGDGSDSEGTTTDGSGDSGEGRNLKVTWRPLDTLDPIASTDSASGWVIQQVNDTLANYKEGTVEIESRLATDWSIENNTKYTFTLAENAKFHNGEDVTADDVVYSLERLAGSPSSRRASFILSDLGVKHETRTVTKDGEQVEEYKPGTLAVNAEDEHTVSIELEEPFHASLPMLAYTSFAVIPEGIIGDVGDYEGQMSQKKFAKEPVGAGPFEFDHWKQDTEAVVTRFEDYHGKVPEVAGVHWRLMSDDTARYTYQMNKNADIFNIPTSKFDPSMVSVEETDDMGRKHGTYGPVRNGETVNFGRVGTISNHYVGFNCEKVDKKVRKAFAYALNQETVANTIFKGRSKPAQHFTPPAIFPGGASGYEEHAKDYPYGSDELRLQKAKELMKEAGYGKNNKLDITLTTYDANVYIEISNLLRDKLASAYMNISVEPVQFPTLVNRGRNGKLEAYTLGWLMDYPAPDNFLKLLYPPKTDTSKKGMASYVNWSGTEAAEKATQAWEKIQANTKPTEAAQKARNEAYLAMEEANWEDAVMIPLDHPYEDRMSYDWVDVPMFGGGGRSRQMLNTAKFTGKRN